MSMPTFPAPCPPKTLEEALSMILESIAMEELGLSHIINAEGEKLQYVLGTLKKGGITDASVKDLLAVNKSIKSLLDSVAQNQIILKSKMECAVDAYDKRCCPTGTTGSTGATEPYLNAQLFHRSWWIMQNFRLTHLLYYTTRYGEVTLYENDELYSKNETGRGEHCV